MGERDPPELPLGQKGSWALPGLPGGKAVATTPERLFVTEPCLGPFAEGPEIGGGLSSLLQ